MQCFYLFIGWIGWREVLGCTPVLR